MNEKKFFINVDVIFLVMTRCHKPLSVKSDVHRTCGIGDRTFYTFRETTYDYAIKESRDFVRDSPSL